MIDRDGLTVAQALYFSSHSNFAQPHEEKEMNYKIPRIIIKTKTNFKTLRSMDYDSLSKGEPLRVKVGRFARNVFVDLLRILPGSRLSTNMCKNYGHVIPERWDGALPHCHECGLLVENMSMLRKANPVGSIFSEFRA